MAHPHTQSDDQQGLLTENHPLFDLYPVTSSEPSKIIGAQEVPIRYHTSRLPCRYWKRTLVLILVPLAVTIYFFWIWLYILSRDFDAAVNYGRHNEQFINYSWFVVGVFGLGLSKYGLVGLEAAMIEKPFWEPPNAASLLMHSESTWSGPGGWIRGLQGVRNAHHLLTHRLWLLLAVLSALPFIALPISGLCFELADGYYSSSIPAEVVGRQWNDFNQRSLEGKNSYATRGWEFGSPPTVPGLGIIHTPEHVRRDHYSGLERVPNIMPLKEETVDIFLAPQAKTPIAGQSWGLRAVYNCSIVKNAAEFTILTDKSKCKYKLNYKKSYVQLETPTGDYIYASSGAAASSHGTNTFGYTEMGVTRSKWEYYGNPAKEPVEAQGLEQTDVYEILLWQGHSLEAYPPRPIFNTTLEPTVGGLGQLFTQTTNGSYVWNETFFEIQGRNGSSPESIKSLLAWLPAEDMLPGITLSLGHPIGLRCQVASTLGTAELNPAQSTFHSFELSPVPLVNNLSDYLAPRLGRVARDTLLGRYIDIFASVNSPAPILTQNSEQYQNFIQPQMLHESVMLALGRDALQLMYDTQSGFEGAWKHPNLTSSTPGRVLTPGTIGPAGPAIILAIWSVSCALLGLWYGFQIRRLESLNGFEFFRLGVLMADQVKGQSGYLTAKGFQQFKLLSSLPGSVKYL
jgi:hypothetical protein